MAKKRVSRKRTSKESFNEDFSNKTVIVMLLVVVVVSTLSLGFYLNALDLTTSPADQPLEKRSNQGVVSLQIIDPPFEEGQSLEEEVASE